MIAIAEQPPADKESTITLGALAREALETSNGHAAPAKSKLLYRLRADRNLLEKVIEAAISDAVYHRMQGNIRHDRESIVRSIDAQKAAQTIDRERDKSRVVALAEAISSCLLDMPLAGGKKLREASHSEIMAQVDRYEKLSGNMMHKARWLRLIAQSVPDGKRVGAVITEKRALELFEESREVERAA